MAPVASSAARGPSIRRQAYPPSLRRWHRALGLRDHGVRAMTVARREPLPDFRALCESACIKLWGEPTSRDRKELRWDGCDAYSAKTFSFKKRVWYDHGAGWGGSTLDLIAYSNGQPKQDSFGARCSSMRGATRMRWASCQFRRPTGRMGAAGRSSRPIRTTMKAINCSSRSSGSTPPTPRTVSASAARTVMAAGFGIP